MQLHTRKNPANRERDGKTRIHPVGIGQEGRIMERSYGRTISTSNEHSFVVARRKDLEPSACGTKVKVKGRAKIPEDGREGRRVWVVQRERRLRAIYGRVQSNRGVVALLELMDHVGK